MIKKNLKKKKNMKEEKKVRKEKETVIDYLYFDH